MNFFITPKGDALGISKVGGVRAIETGLLILGSGDDELLEFDECSFKVAVAWRDAMADMLTNLRPGRKPPQPDWKALAIDADPAWARQKGMIATPAAPKA
jgi:hypothetical protein